MDEFNDVYERLKVARLVNLSVGWCFCQFFFVWLLSNVVGFSGVRPLDVVVDFGSFGFKKRLAKEFGYACT